MSQRKVLLIEPNYSNKYPPIGLMKLATYFRERGDYVVFFKGDLQNFEIERITLSCIENCNNLDPEVNWNRYYNEIFNFIKTRKKIYLEKIDFSTSSINLLIEGKIIDAKNFYWSGNWKKHPEWDFVGVTTLFTFYWDITVETINFAKNFVKPNGRLMVGGVLASLQPKEIEKATGIKPHIGLLNKPGVIDKGDIRIIDELPLDYSILDEIDYQYPMSNAYYGYTSRGCIRKCEFCAVSILEPSFIPYITLKDRIERIDSNFGAQKDLLLMDNNILASPSFEKIIKEIHECGFKNGEKFIPINTFEKSFENLSSGFNDRAYKKRCFREIILLYNKVKSKSEDSYKIYQAIDKYDIKDINTVSKENLLEIYPILLPIYKKYFKPIPRQRYVDFNQGVDARLFNEENVKLLASIPIKPLRIAFDDIISHKVYDRAIRLSVRAGIKDFSNYLLYNYKDSPEDLYLRLKINIDLCDELDISIYSFPMKYHPIFKDSDSKTDYSHNRDYIGSKWNRKYIRAIQAILNSTKGKVGKGTKFFEEAFGKDLIEFKELLEMPEIFILYRFFFKWLDDKISFGPKHWRSCWYACMTNLDEPIKKEILDIIHSNNFNDERIKNYRDPLIEELFGYYSTHRNDIVDPKSEIYKLKQQYDSNPIYSLRRKKSK